MFYCSDHAIPTFFTHVFHSRYEIKVGVSYDSENLTQVVIHERGENLTSVKHFSIVNQACNKLCFKQLAAIVTQPPSARDRGRKLMPSPVAQRALDQGFPNDLIFTPQRAKEVLIPTNYQCPNCQLCTSFKLVSFFCC